MRAPVIAALALPFALSLTPSQAAAEMTLGVNTHFDQGWPRAAFTQLPTLGVTAIREVITWGKVEVTPGAFNWTNDNSGYIQEACDRKVDVLVTLTPRNKAYDAGDTVHTAQGRRAFAAFARAVVDRYPCVSALEIGNEINDRSLKGPILSQLPQGYVELVRDVRLALVGQRRPTALIAGSTLSVATGFQDQMAEAGLLAEVDGITVHPYVAQPELLIPQLGHLTALLSRHGRPVSIWASEVGQQFTNPETEAPPYALKLITLLSAHGVKRADWYALREESFFPGMGLFVRETPRPVVATFAMMTADLLPSGAAARIDTGSRMSFVYRFGTSDRYVVWGADRAITWPATATARNAVGKTVAVPVRLSADPVVIESPRAPVLGPVGQIADSLIDYAGPGWSYHYERGELPAQQLSWVDWKWTPYFGVAGRPNVRMLPTLVTVGPGPAPVTRLSERYTPAASGAYRIAGCVAGRANQTSRVTVRAGDRVLSTIDVVEESTSFGPLLATLRAGQAIDIDYEATGKGGGARFIRRRMVVATNDGALTPPPCPVRSETK